MTEPIGFLHSVILGIVEGLTEFLPVSSTGHLIVTNRLLGNDQPAFEVAIQIGAISAILVLYRQKLLAALRGLRRGDSGDLTQRVNLLLLLFVAALPAALLGLLADEWIEEVLFDTTMVATTTLIGGILLLVLERWLKGREQRGLSQDVVVGTMTVRHALWIGMFQCLALVPGTSRSGSTIAGALLCGMQRPAAAEFSFLVGLPILYGACFLKLWKNFELFTGPMAFDMLTAMVIAFITAMLVVGPFVRFLQRNTFVPFAIYRIFAGIAMFVLIFYGVI